MGGALNNMREKKCCYAACIGTSCGFMTLWSIILLVGGSLISLNIVARNTASINKYLLDPLEGRRTSDLAKPETVDDINDLLVNALQDYDPLPGMPLEEKHSDRHSIFFCKVTTQASAPPSSRQPASWFNVHAPPMVTPRPYHLDTAFRLDRRGFVGAHSRDVTDDQAAYEARVCGQQDRHVRSTGSDIGATRQPHMADHGLPRCRWHHGIGLSNAVFVEAKLRALAS